MQLPCHSEGGRAAAACKDYAVPRHHHTPKSTILFRLSCFVKFLYLFKTNLLQNGSSIAAHDDRRAQLNGLFLLTHYSRQDEDLEEDMQCASHLFLTGMCILLWDGVAASPTQSLRAQSAEAAIATDSGRSGGIFFYWGHCTVLEGFS